VRLPPLIASSWLLLLASPSAVPAGTVLVCHRSTTHLSALNYDQNGNGGAMSLPPDLAQAAGGSYLDGANVGAAVALQESLAGDEEIVPAIGLVSRPESDDAKRGLSVFSDPTTPYSLPVTKDTDLFSGMLGRDTRDALAPSELAASRVLGPDVFRFIFDYWEGPGSGRPMGGSRSRTTP
jgi:hypothetical protein